MATWQVARLGWLTLLAAGPCWGGCRAAQAEGGHWGFSTVGQSGKRTWPEWPEWPEIAGSKRFQANGSRKQ